MWWINITGGENYRIHFIVYCLLFAFTYTDLFEKIEEDPFNRYCIRYYLQFCIETFVYIFLYYVYWDFFYESNFTVQMMRFFGIAYFIQIRYKWFSADGFIYFMVLCLCFYLLFISI